MSIATDSPPCLTLPCVFVGKCSGQSLMAPRCVSSSYDQRRCGRVALMSENKPKFNVSGLVVLFTISLLMIPLWGLLPEKTKSMCEGKSLVARPWCVVVSFFR